MSENAWSDLIRGLELLSRHKTGHDPLACEHDQLYVMSDPGRYTPEELELLDSYGFFVNDDDCFTSYRFGSA